MCDFQLEQNLWEEITYYLKADNILSKEKEELFTVKILKNTKFSLQKSCHIFIL